MVDGNDRKARVLGQTRAQFESTWDCRMTAGREPLRTFHLGRELNLHTPEFGTCWNWHARMAKGVPSCIPCTSWSCNQTAHADRSPSRKSCKHTKNALSGISRRRMQQSVGLTHSLISSRRRVSHMECCRLRIRDDTTSEVANPNCPEAE
ncbi:hypothetical protein B0T16DRAFT_126441 [Cercophora newfieldiana]|uniref:Uncharacterized protein n=1 Tax=Cercophora newfieldiana TaxID=92897 RepID=A0AA40CU71_9PEZI|nr:hypothetical protein B0T16DRAFT_126441 [Cercophora newfieldiana]